MNPEIAEAVYAFIRQYICENNGLVPSQREIASGCYISQPTVNRYLDILEAQTRIARKQGQARSITILDAKNSERM
jgi:DNA-binding GntR family transcriptional regulator